MQLTRDTKSQHESATPRRTDRSPQKRSVRLLCREIRTALEDGSLGLNLQPRYRIASPRLTALEGVISWRVRRRGVLATQSLLELAESGGIVADVGRWALAFGCREVVQFPVGIRLSLTLSALQIPDPTLLRDVGDALAASGAALEQLEICFPEAALMEVDEAMLFNLAALFDRGVSIAIEQFGSSLASLMLMRRVPISCVKLDRGLVRALPDDPEARAIVEAIVTVAHAVGAEVVATGVTYEKQRLCLATLGCDDAQGPLFGEPLEPGALRALAA